MNTSKKIGMVFGQMQVLEARTINVDGKPRSQYKIRCTKCGNERWNCTATVLRGTAKCYECDPLAKPTIPNGIVPNVPKRLTMSYRCMVRRCTNPKHDAWEHYGGRGIKVCREWLFDFDAFVKWAYENGWSEGKTIDRVNPNGNYEPSNCRWADKKTQSNNRSFNIHLTYNGEDMTLAQFCEKTGTEYDRARYLIFGKKMNPDDALKVLQSAS